MNRRVGLGIGPLALLAALIVSLSSAAWAQSLPKARLGGLFPAGARQGTAVEVQFVGEDLQDVSRVYFTHPDITAEKISDADGKPRFRVTVGQQVPVGFYDARLITKFGASNPRTFVVGDLPEVVETEPNNVAAMAMRVELGSVINGRVSPSEDVDFFVFSAKAGERVLIECHGARIDSLLDGFLWLYDSSGRQVASNQDDPTRSEKLDPLIDFTIPADGDYFIKLADFVFAGGGYLYYRLGVSTAPLIDFVLPTAGKPGETQPVTLFGRNLPGGEKTDLTIAGRPLEKLTLPFAFPADAATTLPLSQLEAARPYISWLSGAAVSIQGTGGRSNTKLILASNLPESAEQEPNNTPEQAQRLTVPAGVSGQFTPVKDADYFTFAAKKGETYSIEIFAQRLGSPADPDMEVFDPKGKVLANPNDDNENIGGNKFRSATQDVRYDLTPTADGDYSIRVEHLYGQNQGGPEFVYRLELTQKTEDFQVVCLPLNDQRRDSHVVRQGGRERLEIAVWRLRGHNAEIIVNADHLPPGVTSEPLTIGPGMKTGALVLTAAPDAPLADVEFNIVAKSKVAGVEVERVCRAGCPMWDTANTACVTRMTRSLMLSVRESAPFKITATAPNTTLKQGEPLVVNCHVDRRPDVGVEIQLSGRGMQLPPGVEVPLTKLAAGAADGSVTLQTTKIPPGTFSIPINGEGQVPFERTPGAKETIRCVMPSNLVTFTILPKDGEKK